MVKTGDQIAGYRVESVIGAGGMGVVYEATQLALDRPVALKVLTPGLGTDAEFRERFRREAMLQAALEHPNIVSVYEAGESDDGLYIAMKLVRGVDLTKLIEAGELTPERTLDLLAQIASALDAAHSAGLVHRDVKPQNILVDADDHAFLADFGLTKGAGDRGLTLTGQYAGSLDYAAPEQIRGEPQGASSDLYAFAAILYEALVGQVVFPYDTEAALLYAHLSENPPQPSELRPELPAGLDQVVARGLAKRPEERYRTATELTDDARRALASQPLSALPSVDAGNGRRRFSETIVDGAVLRTAPVITIERERHVPWRMIGAVAVALIALAAGGFAIGRVTHTTHATRLGVAQAGPVSLTFPSGKWKPMRVPSIPGLTLESAVALASTEPSRPGTVVAGLAPQAEGAGLLPPDLRAHLTTAATAQTVRVGPAQGLEYASLAVGNVPWQLGLLLVPTPGGAAAVACLSSQVMQAGTQPADCRSVAATLRLDGIHALPLGAGSAEAQAVSSALTLLDGERLTGRRQLAGATLPAEQARAAAALQAAFAAAAASIGRVNASPFARPAQAGLVSALQVASSRYKALAAAARTNDKAGYAKAATAVDRAERTVDSAISALAAVKPAG